MEKLVDELIALHVVAATPIPTITRLGGIIGTTQSCRLLGARIIGRHRHLEEFPMLGGLVAEPSRGARSRVGPVVDRAGTVARHAEAWACCMAAASETRFYVFRP